MRRFEFPLIGTLVEITGRIYPMIADIHAGHKIWKIPEDHEPTLPGFYVVGHHDAAGWAMTLFSLDGLSDIRVPLSSCVKLSDYSDEFDLRIVVHCGVVFPNISSYSNTTACSLV